jgi:hypothetical protein
MNNCPHCQALARIIQQQQAELKRLNKLIENARSAADREAATADRTMRGNQPRGVWSYARGQRETAAAIAKCLR